MSKLTVEQIIAELEKQEISVDEFAFCDIDNPLPNIGKWEEVEQYGGEGQGETWYSVKYFPAHDVYIRTEGYYYSYSGTEFYDGYGKQVFPKEITKTIYE